MATKNLYPNIEDMKQSDHMAPSAPINMERQNQALLIQDFRNELIKERDDREKQFKSNKRLMNRFHNAEMGLSTLTVALGASGIGVLAGVATIPIGLGLEAASGVCGLVSVLCNRLQKKYEKKSRKNDEIRVLAISKLDLIQHMYSKITFGGIIPDDEFSMLRSEMKGFRQMREAIIVKFSHKKE